jgi:citrate synthase
MDQWLTASEAQSRLGVRPQTLYAYVSRRRIETRADVADPRRSLYRASDIARLCERKTRGRKAALVAQDAIAWGEPVLASAITTIDNGRLFYRGRDAVKLAETWTFESTARLLRGGDGVALKSRRAIPPNLADPRARLFAALAARAAFDPPARGRSPLVLAADATSLLDAIVDAVAGKVGEGPIHKRLAEGWGCGREGGEVIRRALVLLADHELNASTFAARVAASTGASLAAAVLTGLCALTGPLHGGMAARVETFVEEVDRLRPDAAIRRRLDERGYVPGVGHPLYPAGDPRARAMLGSILLPPRFDALRKAIERATGEAPNVDFALTALAASLRLPKDGAFLLFAVARCAGWQAHAIEQIQTGGLIRPRARYVGPELLG